MTINSILVKAKKEQPFHNLRYGSEDELWVNRWVLVYSRSQTLFRKPTSNITTPFQSDFIGASVAELADYVQKNFGRREDAVDYDLAHLYDCICDEIFGVLDDRTAEDESILCVTDNWVSLEDEAYVRVVGGNSTKWDRALARYSNYEYTFEKSRDADIALLHDNIGNPAHSAPVAPILSHALKTDIKNLEMADQEPEKEVEVTEDMKLRVKRWYTETATEGRDVWIGLRLNSQYAFWTIDGIFYRNALDFLVYPDKDEFNERGVMKTGLEPKDHDEL